MATRTGASAESRRTDGNEKYKILVDIAKLIWFGVFIIIIIYIIYNIISQVIDGLKNEK